MVINNYGLILFHFKVCYWLPLLASFKAAWYILLGVFWLMIDPIYLNPYPLVLLCPFFPVGMGALFWFLRWNTPVLFWMFYIVYLIWLLPRKEGISLWFTTTLLSELLSFKLVKEDVRLLDYSNYLRSLELAEVEFYLNLGMSLFTFYYDVYFWIKFY